MNEKLTEQLNLLRMYRDKGCLDTHYKLLIDYIDDLELENKKLKQWDCNKDSRNSRQRVANAKLIKENQQLKEERESNVNFISELQNDLFILTTANNELHNKIDKDLLQIQETYEYGDEWHWDSGAIRDYVEIIERVLKDSDVDE